MEFVLIRHTATALASGFCYGVTDVPLAATATEDIRATLAQISRVDAIFTSPAHRCLALAAALAQRDSVDFSIVPELRELDFGLWEGRRWEDIPRIESDPWADSPWDRAPPGGETEQSLWHRVEAWHGRILTKAQGRIAVVAHGGPLRILRCLLLALPPAARWAWTSGVGAATTFVSAQDGRFVAADCATARTES